MAIIVNYPANMTPEMKYDLMNNPTMQKLSTAKGQRLQISAYMLRDDTNSDGQTVNVLSFKTKDGDLFATNSPICIREFMKIVDCKPNAEFDIIVLDGVSRNGRHYCTCAWAHD